MRDAGERAADPQPAPDRIRPPERQALIAPAPYSRPKNPGDPAGRALVSVRSQRCGSPRATSAPGSLGTGVDRRAPAVGASARLRGSPRPPGVPAAQPGSARVGPASGWNRRPGGWDRRLRGWDRTPRGNWGEQFDANPHTPERGHPQAAEAHGVGDPGRDRRDVGGKLTGTQVDGHDGWIAQGHVPDQRDEDGGAARARYRVTRPAPLAGLPPESFDLPDPPEVDLAGAVEPRPAARSRPAHRSPPGPRRIIDRHHAPPASSVRLP
jgi:hypothetical protein